MKLFVVLALVAIASATPVEKVVKDHKDLSEVTTIEKLQEVVSKPIAIINPATGHVRVNRSPINPFGGIGGIGGIGSSAVSSNFQQQQTTGFNTGIGTTGIGGGGLGFGSGIGTSQGFGINTQAGFSAGIGTGFGGGIGGIGGGLGGIGYNQGVSSSSFQQQQTSGVNSFGGGGFGR